MTNKHGKKVEELKIELWGRVQGVNLRRNLSNFAAALVLTGYVKNRSDGSVLAVAQGERAHLEELLSWCQKAVFPAKVTGMSYEWRDPTEEHQEFKIEKSDPFMKDQAKSFYNLGKEVLGITDKTKIPQHVVIVADGNRRWARSKGWKPWVGHQKAADYERVKPIYDECKNIGVKYLSAWVWSSENWDRAMDEQDAIFDVFRKWVKKSAEVFDEDEVRFRHIGRKDRIPEDVRKELEELEDRSKEHSNLNFQLCLDYGGRDEIVRAVNEMLDKGIPEISEESFSDYLDTAGIPDPDLVIRTSGEKRMSGIMPYQAAYAELYFTNVPFPDFGAEEFRRAILEYSGRTRRFGGSVEEDLEGIDVNALKEAGVDPKPA